MPEGRANTGYVPDLTVTIPSVTKTTADDGDSKGPPVRVVTANQVVAWNLARYRKAAGLTQAELAALIGWGDGAVSDAERSWKGGRVREFDAHALTAIAFALGIPVLALLLPPDGDGQGERWEMDAGPGQGRVSMGDYLTETLIPDGPDGEDGDGENPALAEYVLRYARSVDRYIPDPLQNARAMRWMRDRHPRRVLAEFAARLRRNQASAADQEAFAGELAGAIEKELGEEE